MVAVRHEERPPRPLRSPGVRAAHRAGTLSGRRARRSAGAGGRRCDPGRGARDRPRGPLSAPRASGCCCPRPATGRRGPSPTGSSARPSDHGRVPQRRTRDRRRHAVAFRSTLEEALADAERRLTAASGRGRRRRLDARLGSVREPRRYSTSVATRWSSSALGSSHSPVCTSDGLDDRARRRDQPVEPLRLAEPGDRPGVRVAGGDPLDGVEVRPDRRRVEIRREGGQPRARRGRSAPPGSAAAGRAGSTPDVQALAALDAREHPDDRVLERRYAARRARSASSTKGRGASSRRPR